MNTFAELNLTNSSSLHDVRYYTFNEGSLDIKLGETQTFEYMGVNDIKNASTWEHEHFAYTLNHYGFRMQNVPETVDIGAFGCSFTFGTGMPESGMWHYLLGKKQNKAVANFGIAGVSANSVLDIFLIVSKHVKIKQAVFLLPSFQRFQIAKTNDSDNQIYCLNLIPNHNSKLCECYGIDSNLIYKALPEEQFLMEVRNKIYLAEHIAQQRNIQLYFTTWDLKSYNFLKLLNLKYAKLLPEWYHPVELGNDVARDGYHPGFKLNNFFADKIASHIE